MTAPIGILLIDDHELFREGMARLLNGEEGLHVVGQASSLEEAMTILSQQQPEIILLDYDLDTELGISLFALLGSLEVKPQVLLVTAGMPAHAIRAAVDAGAAGILRKDSKPQQLVDAIRQVFVSKELQIEPSPTTSSPILPEPTTRIGNRPLTRRQQLALKGVVDGLSNRAIAEQMHLSEGSVKAIVQELFDWAGVRTRVQLTRLFLERHFSTNPASPSQE
ncbi:MAG: response regulator transcription factor [Acidobacteriaceae bacterium]|nr:response regulator transcription factor [Acidobacteriaceae bacterium]